MAQSCTVCPHQDRREIDRLLASGISKRRISRDFDLHVDAVRRHASNHLLPDVLQAVERARIADAGTCLQVVRRILNRALEGVDEARGAKEITGLVTAATNCARLLGQVTGEVKQDVFMVFLQAHGIKSEAELKEIVTAHRSASSALTIEQCESDGVALLRWVIDQQPSRKEAILGALSPTGVTSSNGLYPALLQAPSDSSPAPGITAPGGNGSGSSAGDATREG